MIDPLDGASSTLRLLVWQALQLYSERALLPLLDDADVIVRTAAARQIHVRGGAEAFQWALDKIRSKLAQQREMSAFVLGQLGTPNLPFRATSLPMLVDLCTDPSEEVRAAAVAALGHLRANELKATLITAANDKHSSVRQCAAIALGSLDPSQDVEDALAMLQKDPDPSVKDWAEVGVEMLASKA